MRLGIIGTGRIAGRAIEEIRAVRGIELTAVLNPNPAHSREFADKYGIEYAESDPDALTALADAVYIASPHISHYGYASRLLEAGLHVICEKPMAFNPDQVVKLYDLASENGLVLMEAIKTEFCPGFAQIEGVVHSGVIGDVVDVEAAFTRLTPYEKDSTLREYSDTAYGGAWTEFGSYTMLPVFRFLGTDYREIIYDSVPADLTDIDSVDGYTRASFDYGDRFATCRTGLTVKSEGQLVISGTKGYILVPSPWWLTRYFEVRYEDPSKIERYECEYIGDGLRYEFGEFVRRIDGGAGRSQRDEAYARAKVYSEFLRGREI